MLEDMPISTVVGLGGLAIGIAFGAVTRWTDFCVLGAFIDLHYKNNKNRMRAWLLAIAVALVGVNLLHWQGMIDISNAIYLTPRLGWFGAIVGGFMFGYGTVLGGGCGARSLVRVGAGYLPSIITVLFLGIFAYMTMRGLTGIARVGIEGVLDTDLTAFDMTNQGIPAFIAMLTGADGESTRMSLTGIIALALFGYCFKDAAFRRSPTDLVGGISVGLLMTAGWATTGILGADDFDPTPLASLSFVRPVGDSLQYLMTFSGATITFGVATVGGVLLGAFLVAWGRGTFSVRGFDGTEELANHMLGGALMGIGGVMALGCTIAQGIGGVSTLSLGSLLAMLSIAVGCVTAIRRIDRKAGLIGYD